MANRRPGSERGQVSLLYLIVAGVVALVISAAGAYLVVVSQNPAGSVSGPSFVYGSPSPP